MTRNVRTPIIWFGMFMALMLFQTSYMNLGTITAFITLSLTIFTAFTSGNTSVRRFYVPGVSKMLIVFLVVTSLITMISGILPSYYTKYAAQILLCIVLMAIPSLDENEADFLKKVFIIASVVYAFLAIRSCYQLGASRYYHGSIILFNTVLDPNFIGIPIVAASSLVLNNILEGKKRLINVLCYVILAVAIVYTASRSNMLCLLFSNSLVLLFFLKNRDTPIWIRLIWIVVVLVGALYISGYFASNFSQQWERMTVFGEGSDNGRFELWNRAFVAWKHSPIFGNGLSAMYQTYGRATHNTYFQLLSETGLLGLCIFVSFAIHLLIKMYRTNKVYFCLLIGCLIQIAFLDALENRCLWVILCWFSLMPNKMEKAEYED